MVFDVLHGEGDILGSERLAIVPGHALAKMEDIGLLIRQVLPAFRQSGHKAVLILPDQGIEDQAHPDIAGASRVVAVGRGKAPVAGGIGDGEDVNSFISSRGGAAKDEQQQAGGSQSEQGEAAHGRGLLTLYISIVLGIIITPIYV